MKKITLCVLSMIILSIGALVAQTTTTGCNTIVVALPDNDPAGVTSMVNINGSPLSQRFDMNISSLLTGVYRVKIFGENAKAIQRLQKK